MNTTDKLREYTEKQIKWLDMSKVHYRKLFSIADRIDEEHEQLMAEQFDSLTFDMKPMTDENMAEHGWVRLPVDADDVPIRVGDVMEWPTTGETFEVVGIGDGVLFYVEDGSEQADWTGASTKRHHQPDTWEKIIEDALDADVDDFTRIRDALVARCKTLAGDAE